MHCSQSVFPNWGLLFSYPHSSSITLDNIELGLPIIIGMAPVLDQKTGKQAATAPESVVKTSLGIKIKTSLYIEIFII